MKRKIKSISTAMCVYLASMSSGAMDEKQTENKGWVSHGYTPQSEYEANESYKFWQMIGPPPPHIEPGQRPYFVKVPTQAEFDALEYDPDLDLWVSASPQQRPNN